MARRIIRRRKAGRSSAPAKVEEVRPNRPSLPEVRAMPATRVMIASSSSISTILASKLSGSPTVKIVAMAKDDATAVEKMITEDVDVAVVHMGLGGDLQGLDVARNISRACPEAGILVLVDSFESIDLKRNARMFGASWSYVSMASAQKEHALADMVSGVGRGIHWIEPKIKRLLEAVWQVASEGRDLEMDEAADDLNSGSTIGIEPPAPKQRGIQTLQTGNSGIGSGGFGVRKGA